MDFTETPYAEDFMADLGDLIQRYTDMGMLEKTAVMVLKMALEVFDFLEDEGNEDDL